MKKTAYRKSVLLVLAGVLLLGLGWPAHSVPVPPYMSHTRHEVLKDGVGNASLYHPSMAKTRNGLRMIGSSVPTTGTVRLLAIPVQFQADTDPASSGTGQMPYKTWGPASTPGYLQDRVTKLSDYYADTSKGKVTLICTLASVVTLPNTMAKYAQDMQNAQTIDQFSSIMTDTVNAITTNSLNISFAGYDIVMLIHAGCGQEMTMYKNDIWSVEVTGTNIQTPDNQIITGYSLVPETECGDLLFSAANPTIDVQDYEKDPTKYPNAFIPHYWDAIGTWCHEVGHCFGLPDMYDVNYKDGLSLQDWSLMGSGNYLPGPLPTDPSIEKIPYDPNRPYFGSVPCHPDGYCLKLLGWTLTDNVNGSRIHEKVPAQASPAKDGKDYRVWSAGQLGDEYFLLETRSQVGYDKYVPAEGLLIYHIDESVGSIENNDFQIDATHPRVKPLSTTDTLPMDTTIGDYYADASIAFPGSADVTHVGNDTVPNTHDYRDNATGVELKNITLLADGSANGVTWKNCYVDMGTFQVQFLTPQKNAIIFVTRPTLRAVIFGLSPDSIVVDVDGTTYSVDSYDQATGMLIARLGPLSIGRHIVTVSGQDTNQSGMITASSSFTVQAKFLPAGKQMITLPVTDVGTAIDVFQQSPDLYWWNPDTRVYVKYPDDPLEFTNTNWTAIDSSTGTPVAPAGKAFWLNLPAGKTLTLNGDMTVGLQQYVLPVYKGNGHSGDFIMIGNPYGFAVNFNSLLVEYNGIRYPIMDAVDRNLLEPVVYWWAGDGYDIALLPDGTLQPWVGYWIYVKAGTVDRPLKLIFQPLPIPSRAAALVQSPGSSLSWSAKIQAVNTANAQKAMLFFGVIAKGASRGLTTSNIFAPPLGPDGIGLSAEEKSVGSLMRDYLQYSATGKYSWNLLVKGAAGSKINLMWPDLSQVPANEGITVRDTVTGVTHSISAGSNVTVSLGTKESSRLLTLSIAPKLVAKLRITNLKTTWIPMDPSTRISCQLSSPATVVVTITTLAGKLIRQLPAISVQSTMSVSWDGKDAAGRLMPHGTYRCQVQAATDTGQSASATTVLPL